MARPQRIEYEGAVYHVAVRGNERRAIFRDDGDRQHFVSVLADSVGRFEVRLYQYCLMTNHVHLVVETPRANLGRFMHRLQTAYTVYFNQRHNRSGHLVQGRYGAWLVERDAYMLKLSRYVHLNPVFVRSVRSASLEKRIALLRQYRWSTYPGYIRPSQRLAFVDYGPVLAMIADDDTRQAGAYRRFVETGISDLDAAFIEVKAASPLCIGSEKFRDYVHALYEGLLRERTRREDITFRRIGCCLPVEPILEAVCRELGVTRDFLLSRHRNCIPRAVASKMLCDRGGLTERQVAHVLGLGSGAAVCIQLRRLTEALASDVRLQTHVAHIAARLANHQPVSP